MHKLEEFLEGEVFDEVIESGPTPKKKTLIDYNSLENLIKSAALILKNYFLII